MNIRTVYVLILATLASLLLAVYSLIKEPSITVVKTGKAVFPTLVSSLDNVKGLSVKTNERSMTMFIKNEKWFMKESDGYEVDSNQVRRAILSLAGLHYIEAKTNKIENFPKLDLRAPKETDGRGITVQVFDSNNNVLVDAIIGKARYNMPGTTKGGVYFRMTNSSQAWLGSGEVGISRLPEDWLQTKIVDISGDKIKEASFKHPDGELISIKKNTGTNKFVVENIPAGRKLKYDRDPENMATVLSDLELEDVRRADKFIFDEGQVIESRYITEDGLVFRVKLLQHDHELNNSDDDEYWIKVKVEHLNNDMMKISSSINQRVLPWVFRIPPYKGTRLNKRFDDILNDIE